MRTEQITARALKQVGDDRYKLSLIVAKRAEALANGAIALVDADTSKMKFADIALLEVAEGKIGLEAIVEGKQSFFRAVDRANFSLQKRFRSDKTALFSL